MRTRLIAEKTPSAAIIAAMDTAGSAEATVEAGWQTVRDDGRVRAELLEAAHAEARLRRLLPWTGMGELHFSRCTEWPWTWDIPYIAPVADGTYAVYGPSRIETVGRAATAQEAVAMVVDRIPPGTGPLFVGTREQFAAYQATLNLDDPPKSGGSNAPARGR